MDRLGNIASQPSQSHSRLSSHPFAANSQQQENSLGYLSYFIDPEIPTWKRMIAGGALGLAVSPVTRPLFALLIAACSSPSGSTSRPSLAVDAKREGFQRIIRSDSYAGRLVVFLESAEQVTVLNEAVRNYPGVKIERSVSRTAEEESRRHQELETRTGQKFLDWNRVYYVEVRDKTTAERLQTELMTTPGVRLVYPEQIKHGPSLATTPNLEGLQTYLNGPESAGLNITYAWARGVYGAGVMVADADSGINWDHEEFELSRRGVSSGGDVWYQGCNPDTVDDSPLSDCRSTNVAHGTGTIGMLHARHGSESDPHGMKGMVPDSRMTVGTPHPDYNRMPKGSIQLLECATQYSWDGRVTCNDEASGFACVPCLAPGDYVAFREATVGEDVNIVLTAGNGAINLDTTQLIDDATMEEICGGPASDPEAADCWETSGAILVGASQGDRDMVSGQPQKQGYSNCGDDVELYGWGERVVTTSWHPASGPLSNYEWVTVPGGPNPPNDEVNAYFTNEFGGTSAAAAMVAGAATLLQSYFKDISDGTTAGDGSVAQFRYLKPDKIKEFLINSGVNAYYTDGCGIGKQPRMDVAFGLANEFWNDIIGRYPELGTTEIPEDRLNTLSGEGVGLVCTLGREDRSDPACPDSIINPPLACEDHVPVLSAKMDIDGDGRGDLVSWTRGQWKIDLSTGEPADPECGTEGNPPCPEINDNYGSWDITLNYPPVSDWEAPVVMDYDSVFAEGRRGRADLAVYDRENGKWYMSVTDTATLVGEWNGWEYEKNWPGVGDSNVYGAEWYTRPLPADYNGDNWTDLAVQTSDGHWKINFNWRRAEDGWSGCAFEENGPEIPSYADSEGIKDLAYLSDEELETYPGWAYLPSVFNPFGTNTALSWRSPSGIEKEEDITRERIYDNSSLPSLGGMENMPIEGSFGRGGVGSKTSGGVWQYYANTTPELLVPSLNGMFGGVECKPFISDLDGDGLDECTVMCPEEWRVVYSGAVFSSQNGEDGVRRIALGYDNPSTLPGQPVFGGLSYERVEQVRNNMADLGLTNIPSLFDYAMTPYPYCSLPWFVSDMPEECR